MGKDKRKFGQLGEDYAVKLLRKNGYKILERNYHTKVGEIDIVAAENDTLIFVEVKTRWSRKFGKPEEAVTPTKLSRIKKAGQYYSLTHPTLPKALRIDVVAIEVEKGTVTSAKIIQVDG